MGLKSDKWIREQSIENQMIEPFCEENIGDKEAGAENISFGA